MNIIERLEKNEYAIDELIECLNSNNPIVLHKAATTIVRNNIKNNAIIEKLLDLSNRLNNNSKILGYYKVGHLAMGTLLKLEIDKNLVFKENLDAFEKEMALRFYADNEW